MQQRPGQLLQHAHRQTAWAGRHPRWGRSGCQGAAAPDPWLWVRRGVESRSTGVQDGKQQHVAKQVQWRRGSQQASNISDGKAAQHVHLPPPSWQRIPGERCRRPPALMHAMTHVRSGSRTARFHGMTDTLGSRHDGSAGQAGWLCHSPAAVNRPAGGSRRSGGRSR